ncbi:MAG: AbrB/MazE/SpoVT family DNA-binding domain-containing protein [Deltaproteobacteria bacterium]|nr:AbrB/MazE/SpoVT family DNA-binding domain-containing protein [Deltaproteobacteria bacterium]
MPDATITSKGQVTIPKKVREALHLRPGDKISFVVRNGKVEIYPHKIDILSLRGIIKPRIRGVTIEQMNEAIAKAASEQ